MPPGMFDIYRCFSPLFFLLRKPGRHRLQMALRAVQTDYIAIGIFGKLAQFLEILEYLLPQFFSNVWKPNIWGAAVKSGIVDIFNQPRT